MDPNRHHEFIGGNGETQSAMYFNRGNEENRANTQYYSQERVIVNNKSCMCPSMSSNIRCNACPPAPDGKWNQDRTPRVDFQAGSVTEREKVNPNSMYIHESRQYFHPNSSPAYTTEVVPTNRHIVSLQKDRNTTSTKNCAVESNYNFKQQQPPQFQAQPNLRQMQTQSNIANVSNLPPQQLQHHHQHISAVGNYSKEIIYDEKYQSRQILYKDVKANYTPVSGECGTLNTAPVFNEVMHSQKSTPSPLEIIRNTKVDSSNIINPSNSLALKEQQASPNYGRKFPQIFSHNDLGNTHTGTHQSLYMSTPQFSSDNFNTIHTQRKMLHQSEHKVHGCTADLVKVNELQMSAISGYTSNNNNSTSSKYHYQQMHDSATQQTHLQEPLTSNDIARNQSYYLVGDKPQIATATEMLPIFSKQTQITSQYSNNPKALPSHSQLQSVLPHQSHHHPAKITTTHHDLINFKKKEDIYEPMIHPNTGLYANPYKTSSPIDTCCKDVSTPYTSMTNSFSDNIGQQHHYYKYGKFTKDTVGKNNICPQNQNTPPPTPVHRTAGYKTQPYIYETQHIKYDGNVNNTNFNMSPNVATVASPSPSQTTPPNHVQAQHANLSTTIPQGRTQSQSPTNYGQEIRHQHHNQIEIYRPSARTHLEGAAMHSNTNFCTYDRPPQNPKLTSSQPITIQHSLQLQPTEQQIQPKTISNISNQGLKQNSIKKTHVPKTNYRELINQVVAMRSATSEKELDLQIIKKALNSATGSPMAGQPVEKLSQSMSVPRNSNIPVPNNSSVPNLENGFLIENVSIPTHRNSSKICVDRNIPDIQRKIKVEEPLSSSPLDLSMRTVKTKADSTEYRYRQELFKNPQLDYKHALPRVDFTPNFSLHSDEMSVVPKILINQQQNPHLYTLSSEVPSNVVPVGSKSISVQSQQSTQQTKQYSTEPVSRISTVKQRTGLAPVNDPKQKSLIFKTSDENSNMCQIRPSVVETNPFATVRSIKSEPISVIDRNDHFQAPTNNVITFQQKSIHSSATDLHCAPTYCGGSVIKSPDQISLFDIEKPLHNAAISVNMTEQRHPNYLGRKRHLQEYSNSQRNEPMVKQQRYQDRDALTITELIPMTTISTSVIAVNDRTVDENIKRDAKTVEKSIQAEINPCCKRESSIIVNNSVPICKLESITPTLDAASPSIIVQPPVGPIKTETSSVIAARIRTKAELKGFTFNTPIDIGNTMKEAIKIKEEPIPCQTFSSDLPSIPGLDEKYDSGSLLDFSWNNKCNDFMEQLLTRPQTKKPPNGKFININKEITGDCSDITNASALERKTSNIESDENSKSWDRVGDAMVDSAMTGERGTNKSPEGNSSHSASTNAQKKISKQDREKIRSQQEKRMAARIREESSSESDDEIHKRKSDRSKKPLIKTKARQNTQAADTKQFSDCGSDSSDSNDLGSSPTKACIQTNEENDDHLLLHTAIKQKTESVEEKNIVAELLDKSMSSKKPTRHTISGAPKLSENEDALESSSTKKTRLKATHRYNEETPFKQDKLIKSEEKQCKSKEEIGQRAKKPKVLLKLGLNTMTRSKRKREMELQLANSKVLRNDKIIRNSATTIMSIKRKYVRKYGNQSSLSGVCKELSSKQSDRELSMRLRSRNEKSLKGETSEKVPGSNCKKSNKTVSGICKNESQDVKSKGKERQTDMFLEVYRYKRSLKIPPSLITIDHPHNIKMAASLPELDDSLHTNSNKNSTKFAKSLERLVQKSSQSVYDKSTPPQAPSKTQQEQKPCDERRSIIDVLHSRVINTNSTHNGTKTKNKKNSNSHTIPRQVHSDVSGSAESSLVTEMLSIPVKKANENELNEGKKRHFSIFETTVLKTKTRTESKMQQRKEIIREIFVGDDRPASAPPEIISQMSEATDKMTFEQKYEQFLQQLNIVINDDKLRKYGKTTSTLSSHSVSGSVSASTSIANHYLKDEEDTLASSGAAGAEYKALGSNNKSFADADSATTSSFRRRRPGKYLRRKGSSGFDYIRKKKKPNPNSSASLNSMQNMHILGKLERKTEDEIYERKIKTESDVCREIQKWVLNKSVGQSAMHKAARLGYIDVVVYCLDRMGMNPDQKDNAGYTPLHEACTKGWLEIARVLLQYGANHSEAAHSGIRPLHEASENDHEEVVRLLLSYGADPLLATYSGQTPLMLASSAAARDLLNNHLSDVQNVGPRKKPWHFKGPWDILDLSINGYDIFGGAPNFICDMSRALRKSSISNSMSNKKQLNSSYFEAGNNCKTMMENCAVVLDNIDRFNSVRLYNDNKPEILVENSDSEGEMFEFEEADILLPPLYLLEDEGTDKWVLLSDLCNLLKVKSKDTLLNKIYPPSSSASSAHKSLMRELKMSDFLERATCLQLLCAGEKINICASKVVLIKYNDSVRNLLGVKTILMKF